MAPHDAWAVLITVHGRLLTTCRRTSSRLEGSFHHGVSWPITVVSRCPWTSILQRGHDPLKFYESPGDGRYLRLALRAGFWGIGAVGSALPWHGRGQGFESPMLHVTKSRKPLVFAILAFREPIGDSNPRGLAPPENATAFSGASARNRRFRAGHDFRRKSWNPLCSTSTNALKVTENRI